MKDKYFNQKGQVLLIIVLVMIIALTVGLSLISRSITNLKTSNEEVNSQKALSAAEAGIDQIIKANNCPPTCSFSAPNSLESGANYSGTIAQVSGSSVLVNGGDRIPKNDGADIWLSDYSTDSAKLYGNPRSGSLVIHWGTGSTSCTNPAIEVIVVQGTKDNPTVKKYAYDPCSPQRTTTNNFQVSTADGTALTQGSSTINFSYKTPSIAVSNALIVRVIPLYYDTPIGVTTVSPLSLPLQGTIITSSGTSGTSKRTVTVFQGFPKIPAEFFPYSLFSP